MEAKRIQMKQPAWDHGWSHSPRSIEIKIEHPFPVDVLLEQVPIPAALSGLAYGEDLAGGSKGFGSEDRKTPFEPVGV